MKGRLRFDANFVPIPMRYGCPHHHKQSKHKHTSPEVDEKIDDCGLSLLLPNPVVVVVGKRYAEEQPDKVNLCQEALQQSSQVKSDCGFVDDGRSHSSSRFVVVQLFSLAIAFVFRDTRDAHRLFRFVT